LLAATTLLIRRRLQETPFHDRRQGQCPIADVVEEHGDFVAIEAHHYPWPETAVPYSLLDYEGTIRLWFVRRRPGMAVVAVATSRWVRLTEVLQEKLPPATQGLRVRAHHLDA
jgi:hypothetical protein